MIKGLKFVLNELIFSLHNAKIQEREPSVISFGGLSGQIIAYTHAISLLTEIINLYEKEHKAEEMQGER